MLRYSDRYPRELDTVAGSMGITGIQNGCLRLQKGLRMNRLLRDMVRLRKTLTDHLVECGTTKLKRLIRRGDSRSCN
ncbi:hypothetical protein PQR05_37370 [Paraburkholderia sediminicola]|uniref:hypothetical protein n=1 Tax=Paraburkholderia sediminicola TaxID=458836 RepID=UPI0038BBCF8E